MEGKDKMSMPPSGPPGGSFLPFMTSVTTDIYGRIEKLSQSLDQIFSSVREMINGMKENLTNISKNIQEMIEQGEMNKQMTLEAFADSMNTLVQQIRKARDENIEILKNTQTQQIIRDVNNTALLLESRMYDIQIAFMINGIYALINAIKAGKVVGIPVPMMNVAVPSPQTGTGPSPQVAAPIPTLADDTSTEESEDKKTFFGKGVRKKTHDEIMEEKRKKDAMFRKFLR